MKWILPAAALAILASGSALARPMAMVESNPTASAVIHSRSAEFFVRFDGPVDHRRSRPMEIHVVWPHTRYLPSKTRAAIDALAEAIPPLLSAPLDAEG